VSTAVLAGAFGQRNPGDEALLRAFLTALPAGWDAVATSATPAETQAAHGVPAVHARDGLAVARAVHGADAVVFAGGTVFKRLSPATGRPPLDLLAKALAVALLARTTGRRLAMVGVGAAPLRSRSARLLARTLVSRADLLVLRDEESADLLAAAARRAAPFRVGSDAAWTLMHDAPDTHAGGDQIVVAVSHEAGGRALVDYLSEALTVVAASGRPIALQPWQATGEGIDDLLIAQAVAGRLRGAATVLDPPANLRAARVLYRRSAVVLGLRFHALIAAAAAGAPFVALAHEPKLAGLARRLGQPSVPPRTPPGLLGRRLLAAATQPAPAAMAVRAEIAAAEAGFRLLRLLLSAGREAEPTDGLALRPLEEIR
jgi:polysaccharide pyruvyl transferase CsaB